MDRTLVTLLLVTMMGLAPSAFAGDKPLSFSLGGGVVIPVGGVGTSLGTGGLVTFGLTYKVQPRIGILGEYTFSSLGKKRLDVPQPLITNPAVFDGNGWFQSFGGSIVFSPAVSSPKLSPYVIAGLGAYNRHVYVTTPATGLVTLCDPNWLICYPQPVAVDTIIGSRSTTDMGFSIGGGVTYTMSELASFFVEARYHYVFGPDVKNASGGTQKASAQFFPITFGFRF